MVYVIAGLAVVFLLVLLAAAQSKRGAEPDGFGESRIYILVTLATRTQLNEFELSSSFGRLWNARPACKELPNPPGPSRMYALSDGRNSLLITFCEEPVPKHLVDITLQTMAPASDGQRQAFRNHSAYLLLRYASRGGVPPLEQMRFSVAGLLALMKCTPATGCINVPAQLYLPKEVVDGMPGMPGLDAASLQLLTTVVQVVDEGRTQWMHTHGLEQYGLPDLQVRFTDKAQTQYYWDLISNAAVYGMKNGPVVQPGHTAELAGDGIIYAVRAVSGSDRAHFGRLGALEISRK